MITQIKTHQERSVERVISFLKQHPQATLAALFGNAYQTYHGVYDQHEVKCNVERFMAARETPDYVLDYLQHLN